MGTADQGGLAAAAMRLRGLLARKREGQPSGDDESASAPSPATDASSAGASVGSGDSARETGAWLRAASIESSHALWLHALGADSAAGRPAAALRQRLRDATLAALDGDLGDNFFPRRPLLMPKLMAELRDPGSHAHRILDLLKQDPVLTGNLLRLAGSVRYRSCREPIESLDRAIAVCGTDGLVSLVRLALMQPVFRVETGAYKSLPALLWERTTRATSVAERYAQALGASGSDAVQIVVLLRALGALVVFRILDSRWRTQFEGEPDGAAWAEVLSEVAGFAAQRIATRWESSPRIVATLARLQGPAAVPANSEADDDSEVKVVRGAELLATTSLLQGDGRWNEALLPRLAAAVSMPEDWVRATLAGLAASDAPS